VNYQKTMAKRFWAKLLKALFEINGLSLNRFALQALKLSSLSQTHPSLAYLSQSS
jgi:hypothetical protein